MFNNFQQIIDWLLKTIKVSRELTEFSAHEMWLDHTVTYKKRMQMFINNFYSKIKAITTQNLVYRII